MKKKARPLTWTEEIAREREKEEDNLAAQRIKQRIAIYDSQFKGDIERTYREYIGGRHWVERKAKYYETHEKKCALCGSTTRVELNHIYYGNFGYEKDEDLIPLCRQHHQECTDFVGVHKDMRYATADFLEWKRSRMT